MVIQAAIRCEVHRCPRARVRTRSSRSSLTGRGELEVETAELRTPDARPIFFGSVCLLTITKLQPPFLQLPRTHEPKRCIPEARRTRRQDRPYRGSRDG